MTIIQNYTPYELTALIFWKIDILLSIYTHTPAFYYYKKTRYYYSKMAQGPMYQGTITQKWPTMLIILVIIYI